MGWFPSGIYKHHGPWSHTSTCFDCIQKIPSNIGQRHPTYCTLGGWANVPYIYIHIYIYWRFTYHVFPRASIGLGFSDFVCVHYTVIQSNSISIYVNIDIDKDRDIDIDIRYRYKYRYRYRCKQKCGNRGWAFTKQPTWIVHWPAGSQAGSCSGQTGSGKVVVTTICTTTSRKM